MPLIEDMLDQVGDCKFLSKIDLSKGFYQVPLSEADKDKTVFCTPFGKFRFNRMPFGLVNALATFQRMKQEVLADLEEYCAVYIDDILIYSKTWEEHLKHLRAVLERLRQNKLTAKPSKCVWAAEKLDYLGHVVGGGTVAVPQARVKAIKNFKKPVTKKDMRAFLGMTGYYHRFIKNYGDRAWNLTKATTRDAPKVINWTTDMTNDFMWLVYCFM